MNNNGSDFERLLFDDTVRVIIQQHIADAVEANNRTIGNPPADERLYFDIKARIIGDTRIPHEMKEKTISAYSSLTRK